MEPIIADSALSYSFKQVSTEGYLTMTLLAIVSLFSWSVIISKAFQLNRARRMSKKFLAAWKEAKDPLEIAKSGVQFDGAPAYEIYMAGAQEVTYHLKNNPVGVKTGPKGQSAEADMGETDIISRAIHTRISLSSFDLVKGSMERTAGAEALSLEKGMIVLSTAVAGGPFIGLLGTVFGVMETFAGIAVKQAASIAAMAPGVAGALLNTVIGLFVAIPAMFAYNFQVTNIRGMTQEMDNFVSELVTAFEHKYVDNRPLSEEIRDVIAEQAKRSEPALAGK
jgi:biopolymer transport protein ExbB/TolQ